MYWQRIGREALVLSIVGRALNSREASEEGPRIKIKKSISKAALPGYLLGL